MFLIFRFFRTRKALGPCCSGQRQSQNNIERDGKTTHEKKDGKDTICPERTVKEPSRKKSNCDNYDTGKTRRTTNLAD